MGGTRRVAGVALALACVASAPTVEAQVSEQRVADYRQTAERGAAAFNEGDLRTARAQFERAATILPNPRVYRLLGRVALAEQRFVEAAQLFHRALDMEPGDHPLSPALRRQLEAELLPEARRHVAELRVDLEPADALLTVDGAATALVAGVLVLAPGAHQIEAAAPGYTRHTLSVDAAAGSQDVLRIHLTADGSEGPVAVARAPRGPDEGLVIGGITSLIAGGLALGAFAVVGAIAVSDRDSLASSCGVTTSCANSDLAAVERLNVIADVNLAVGATAAIVGAVLLGVAYGEAGGPAEAPAVSAWMGPTGAGLTWSRRW